MNSDPTAPQIPDGFRAYPKRIAYRHIGVLASTPPGREVELWCDQCLIRWTGCQDEAACPQCDDTSAWEWSIKYDNIAVEAAR